MLNSTYNQQVEKTPEPESARHLLRNLLHFVRALRKLGLPMSLARLETWTLAIPLVGLESRVRFKDAARSILVSRKEHLAVFDSLFDTYFRPEAFAPISRAALGHALQRAVRREERLAVPAPSAAADPRLPEVEAEIHERHYVPSDLELLRYKDFADLTADERSAVLRLLAKHTFSLPPRRTRRHSQHPRRGEMDLGATLRQCMRRGGEPIELLRRRQREQDRPLVVLCDISGSMEAYARIFLSFAYTLKSATSRLEVFVFATRLTRITREMRGRNVDLALQLATTRIADWGGGTRIGESLKRFNFGWARRLLGRGAWVIVLSDGWDRGERSLLEHEMARLRRSANRVIWLNPLLGSAGYEPISGGIRAVLPHIDDFLPVHDLRSLEQLAAILGETKDRPG